MKIQLKRKYSEGKRYSTNKASSGNSGNNKRNKLGQSQKKNLPPQRQKVLWRRYVDGKLHSTFVYADEIS